MRGYARLERLLSDEKVDVFAGAGVSVCPDG
jgi:hypothetical protein